MTWFRKTHDHLEAGGRAGLVATNSIREGRNREAALQHVVGNGGLITNAVSNQVWPGEANVHVSIVNWVKEPPNPVVRFMLDGVEASGIASTLRAGVDTGLGSHLDSNAGRQFFGIVPGGEGFVLTEAEATKLVGYSDTDYGEVVRPFLIGSDITNRPDQSPSRFIIDFHFDSLEDAAQYPVALERVRWLVKPHRDTVKRKAYREKWWRLEEPIIAMRVALSRLTRFIACPAQGKRFYMVWCEPEWCPSNLTSVFAFDDDSSMGVLSSRIHIEWAMSQSTKLKSDPRYTSASFMTFPWPSGDLTKVGETSRRLYSSRSEICLEREIGLTKLYNEVDEGAYRDLRELHDELDEAVAAAYGWPSSPAHDPQESNRLLLELNRAIAAGELDYNPFN